jgi:hypothetical protein
MDNENKIYKSLSVEDKKTYDRMQKISPCEFGTCNGELVLFTEYPPDYDKSLCYHFTRLLNWLSGKEIKQTYAID